MSETAAETRSVVVEREVPFPPERIWRALTQPHLIEAWLMKNDFKPAVDHRFKLSADWGSVDCQVLEVAPPVPADRAFDMPLVISGRVDVDFDDAKPIVLSVL